MTRGTAARRTAPVLAVLLVLVPACSTDDRGGDTDAAARRPSGATTTTSATPGPSPTAQPAASPSASPAAPPTDSALQGVQLRLRRVAVVERPTAVVEHEGVLYVTEIRGRVRAVRGGRLDPTPVLDVSGDVGTDGEGGLLGLAFAPDGRTLLVSYTNQAQDSRVVEFAFDGRTADPASRREVLAVEQPDITHNGGGIAFGPDGMLWIGLGDGGHDLQAARNAQDPTTVLGAMLRIDVRPSAGRPYTVPPDNPFVGRPGVRPEVWAKGLRNPWRWSFDDSGRLWIGDVGEAEREEVTVLDLARSAGANLGWPALEGTRRHLEDVPVPEPVVRPVLEYAHDGGDLCSVVGGYVYRGAAIPALRGAYVYADTCEARLRAASVVGGRVVAQRVFADVADIAQRTLVSLGQDSAGELYAVSIDGPVYRVVPA